MSGNAGPSATSGGTKSPKGKEPAGNGGAAAASAAARPSPPEPQAQKEVSQAAFKAAFEIAKILSGLSKKDQKSAMQMAGVQAGLSVTSSFVPAVASATAVKPAAVPKGQKGPKAPPPVAKWGPAVKEKQSQIASLNQRISEKSAGAGGAELPDSDPLLAQRAQAFRELKALKASGKPSQ